MTGSQREGTRGRRAAWGPRWLLLLSIGLLAGPGLAACGGASGSATVTAAWGTPGPTHTMAPDAAMSAAMDAAWAMRPAYTSASPRTEAAYAIALRSPELLQWMPCYCGCEAMDHRSNLHCYFKPTMDPLSGIAWEEHASFCDICVDITIRANQLREQGQSLRSIRDAIDREFGGSTPGTPTELPPA